MVKLGLDQGSRNPGLSSAPFCCSCSLPSSGPRRPSLPSLQAQLRASAAWPPEVTSSRLPGVWCGCQASPLFTHWAYSLVLAAPWRRRGHCSVSEVAAVLPKSSGAGEGGSAPEEQNGEPAASRSCRLSPVQSGPFESRLTLGAGSGALRVALPACPRGALPPSSLVLSSPALGLRALGS